MNIGAVILAAGLSSRMKKNKLLLDLHGKRVVEHVFQTVKDSVFDSILVVTGRDHDLMEELASKHGLDTVLNPNYKEGQSTSVRKGLETIHNGMDAIMFFMGDQPCIKTDLIKDMIRVFNESSATILVPISNEGRGNPVIFSSKWYEDLEHVEGDKGGRTIIKNNPDQVLYYPITDDLFFMDVDTKDMYNQIKKQMIKD